MKIVSFNVNGIRARLHQLEAVIEQLQPDIIGLQEIKVADEAFPREAVEALGYHLHHHGQKGHYGVALLSRQAPLQVEVGFPTDGEEAQRRMIIGRFDTPQGPLTVMNGYFPQGESRDHPLKFPAKQKFYADLQAYLESAHQPDDQLVVMGDFNIAPVDEDIGIGPDNAKRWLRTGKTSFLPEERDWFERLRGWGLSDSFRQLYPEVADRFSWFDYRSKGFDADPKRGLRIDHLLISAPLQGRLRAAGIDYAIRAMEKPSDHCPVWIDLDL